MGNNDSFVDVRDTQTKMICSICGRPDSGLSPINGSGRCWECTYNAKRQLADKSKEESRNVPAQLRKKIPAQIGRLAAAVDAGTEAYSGGRAK